MMAGAEVGVDVQYAGTPRPEGPWGEVGWEELTDGVIVAGQPDGAPTWFPCNDHPGDKAGYRIAVTTESPYNVVANGGSSSSGRGQPDHVGLRAGRADGDVPGDGADRAIRPVGSPRPVPMHASLPRRLRAPSSMHDFGRQPEMINLFSGCSGPIRSRLHRRRHRRRPGDPARGAGPVDVRRQPRATVGGARERLVAHELAHQWFGNSLTVGRWRDIWLHEGFACYAEWLWSESSGGPRRTQLAREARHSGWRDSRRTCCSATPGRS